MFPVIEKTIEVETAIRCDALNTDILAAFNKSKTDYFANWDRFWDTTLSVEKMQAQVDFFFNLKTTDNGVETNALDQYFANAALSLHFLGAVSPADFANLPVDVQGRKLPDYPDYPYRKYMSAGWIYTVEPSGRMVVTEPCQWE